jgi:hypothetical protein
LVPDAISASGDVFVAKIAGELRQGSGETKQRQELLVLREPTAFLLLIA